MILKIRPHYLGWGDPVFLAPASRPMIEFE